MSAGLRASARRVTSSRSRLQRLWHLGARTRLGRRPPRRDAISRIVGMRRQAARVRFNADAADGRRRPLASSGGQLSRNSRLQRQLQIAEPRPHRAPHRRDERQRRGERIGACCNRRRSLQIIDCLVRTGAPLDKLKFMNNGADKIALFAANVDAQVKKRH